MSDNMNLRIDVDVAADTKQAAALRSEFDRIEAEILAVARAAKSAAGALGSLGKGRNGSGAADEAREALNLDRARYNDLTRVWAFQKRMGAQRSRQEADIARQLRDQQREAAEALKAQERAAAQAARERARAESAAERQIREEIRSTARLRDRERRNHERALQRAAQGAAQVHAGAGRAVAIGAAGTAGAGYVAERAIERGISSRKDIDTAETNLKIFGDMPDGRGGKRAVTDADIRNLRRGPAGLDYSAIQNGVSIRAALEAYTEVAKAGLMDPMAQAKNLLAATTALELDPRATTKLLGTMARNMGSAATPARLKQTLNAVAIGAREDPTQANEIVEGLNRAQPLLAMSRGFTEEDLVALVSGGQSVGIQPGKAGTFLPAIARNILEGNDKFLDKKKRKELNFAAGKLGYGTAKNLAMQFAGENGKNVYFDLLTKLKAMPAEMRQQVANALGGGQWGDEFLQHVNGLEGMKATHEAINDPRNANFLTEARDKKSRSWEGMWNQSKAIWSLFWESFGVGFDGILREINQFFLDLHTKFDYDRVSEYVRNALDGLREGLGLDSWKSALKSLFPGDISGLGERIKSFARGFGDGIKSVAATIRSVASTFGGPDASAETIGRLAGKFVILTAACAALSPVIGIIGGLAAVIAGIAGVARAAAGVLGMGAAGAAGGLGGGAVAGALAGVAKLLSGGFIVGLAGAIGNMRGEISTLILAAVKPLVTAIREGLSKAFSWDGIKSGGRAILEEIVPAPLKRWLEGDGSTKPGTAQSSDGRWVDPPLRAPVQELKETLERNTEALEDSVKLHRQSYESETFRDLIRPASFSPGASAISGSIRSTAGRAAGMTGAIGAMRSGDYSGPAIARSMPGSYIGGASGMRRRGVMGGGGSGSGAAGASDNSPVGPFRGSQHFDSLAPRIMADLRKDFGLSKEEAAAVLGNLGHESGGFRFHQEVNPRGGGRGGIGWAQWTGPRRRQYEAWCASKGLDPRSYEANYSFLRHELQTSEKGAIGAVKRAVGLDGKTAAFENVFERAGVKAYGSRNRFARRAMGLPDGEAGVSGPVAGAQQSVQRLQDIGGGIKSSGWKPTPAPGSTTPSTGKPGLGEIDVAPRAPLGSTTPMRSGAGGGAGRSAGGGTTTISAPISITSHGGDAREVASQVQRHLQQQMDRRTHDSDGFA